MDGTGRQHLLGGTKHFLNGKRFMFLDVATQRLSPSKIEPGKYFLLLLVNVASE